MACQMSVKERGLTSLSTKSMGEHNKWVLTGFSGCIPDSMLRSFSHSWYHLVAIHHVSIKVLPLMGGNRWIPYIYRHRMIAVGISPVEALSTDRMGTALKWIVVRHGKLSPRCV